MGKKVSIVGAGSHTRSLINLLNLNDYLIQGIYDDNYKPGGEIINNYRLLGKLSDIAAQTELILSIGDNKKRSILFGQFKAQMHRNNIYHPFSRKEEMVTVTEGNQFFSGVYVNSNVSIGSQNLLNTNCVLEHQVSIGDFNHISVGAILCGKVKIGNTCFVGAGAVVVDKVSICDNVTVGANSVVISDICEPGTYVGNPVRKIK